MDADIIIFALIWIIVIVYSITKSKKKQTNSGKVEIPRPQNSLVPSEKQIQEPVSIQEPKNTFVQYSIPEEGQRSTISKPKKETVIIEATGLHNKENLKRAIIFGEILQPKF